MATASRVWIPNLGTLGTSQSVLIRARGGLISGVDLHTIMEAISTTPGCFGTVYVQLAGEIKEEGKLKWDLAKNFRKLYYHDQRALGLNTDFKQKAPIPL